MKAKENFFLAFLSVSIILIVILTSFVIRPHKYDSKYALGESSANGCTYSDLSGIYDNGDIGGVFEGVDVASPALADAGEVTKVLGATTQERWIEVDLSEQKLRAWEGGSLFLETPVSTGLPWWPTPTGEFRVWIKLRATKMEGGQGANYYYLPNVPWVMFFENENVPGWKGYGLHGTYWHNDFGTPRSHGCVNLPNDAAREIYYWVGPNFGDSQYVARSSAANPGTRIVIHE